MGSSNKEPAFQLIQLHELLVLFFQLFLLLNTDKLVARTEGILLDPIYTGKGMAGLIDLIRKGVYTKDEKVLFWHTGGTPSLFTPRYRNLLL